MTEINQNITDEELVPLLQDPLYAEKAFAILLERYSQQLYMAIRRILYDHELTNDTLQNTFIKAWKNINNFRGDSKLFTWLYAIATNEALTQVKKENTHKRIPVETVEYNIAETLMSDPFFDGNKAEADLYAAIDRLPEKQKNVFRMRYFDELSYKDISNITCISIGSLKASYHHAVQKLLKYLIPED